MVENQEPAATAKIAELALDQNVCRVIELGDNRFMCASYHLDKATDTK